jgi:hypothetical protein
MISDSGSRPEQRPQADLWKLPYIQELTIRRIKYSPPETKYIKSPLARYNEAVEFTVTVDEPFQARAVTPILYVGDEPVTEALATDHKTVYRFLAFEFERLKEGAPISIGWPGQAEPREKTGFEYSLGEHSSRSE